MGALEELREVSDNDVALCGRLGLCFDGIGAGKDDVAFMTTAEDGRERSVSAAGLDALPSGTDCVRRRGRRPGPTIASLSDDRDSIRLLELCAPTSEPPDVLADHGRARFSGTCALPPTVPFSADGPTSFRAPDRTTDATDLAATSAPSIASSQSLAVVGMLGNLAEPCATSGNMSWCAQS